MTDLDVTAWVILPICMIGAHYALRLYLYDRATKRKNFCLPTAGEIQVIMKGNSPVEFIYDLIGKVLDKNGKAIPWRQDLNEFRYSRMARDEVMGPRRAFLRWFFWNFYGVIWVGIKPYRVFMYHYSWLKYEEQGVGGNTYALIAKSVDVWSIYDGYDTYGLRVDNAETGASEVIKAAVQAAIDNVGKKKKKQEKSPISEKGKIAIIAEFTFGTETVNPDYALFKRTGISTAGDWILVVNAILRDHLKAWLGSSNWEALVSQRGTTAFETILIAVNAYTIRNIGIKVTDLRFLNVDLKDEALKTALQAPFIAHQNRLAAEEDAQAVIVRAKGKRAEVAAQGLGEADGFKAIIGIDAHDKNRGERLYKIAQVGKLNTVKTLVNPWPESGRRPMHLGFNFNTDTDDDDSDNSGSGQDATGTGGASGGTNPPDGTTTSGSGTSTTAIDKVINKPPKRPKTGGRTPRKGRK